MATAPTKRGNGHGHRRSAALAAAALVLLSVCGDPPTGIAPGGERAVRLAFAPTMNQATQRVYSLVGGGIDNVHLVLRNATGAVVLDTLVAFPATQDSVVIAASVLVHGESEHFAVRFELRTGATTLFEGVQSVTAKAGATSAAPASIPLVFVGPGARAARVVVSPTSATLLAGASSALSATAFDSTGGAIPGAVIAWSSSAEQVVQVSASGVATAQKARGTAVITAQTPNGTSGSATVSVTLPATTLVVKSGDAQTGTVGTALARPFVIQAQAADGVGVAGVVVAFATASAGASVSATSATTDASGNASVTGSLGTTAGRQLFTATAPGLSAVTMGATATRDAASALTLVSGDAQADTIGRALRAPFVVQAADRFGNRAAGVTVSWSRVAGAGTLGASASVTDSAGEARASYTLGNTPGAEVIGAALGGVAGASVTFRATALPRAASRVVLVSGDDQSGAAGSSGAAPLVVRVTDDVGNLSVGAVIAWTATNGATLGTPTSTVDSAGLAHATFTYATRAGAFAVLARLGSATTGGVQFNLTAKPGAAASLAITSGDGQSAAGGAAVSVAPSVAVTDRYGNVVPGVYVTFTPSSGGSVTGSPALTTGQGIATVGSWTLGATAGAQILTAGVGAVSVNIKATATVTVVPVLAVAQQPSATVSSGGLFATQPRVQLKTSVGAVVKTAGVVVTAALKYAGPTLRGTLTATTDTAGVAVFSSVGVKGVKGANALSFSAAGYTTDTSATFKITAGAPVAMAASSTTVLSGTVNTVVSPNPTVIVTDSSGNGVAGVSVLLAVADTAHGVVTGGAAVSDTNGLAAPTNWTLGKRARTDTLSATATGVTGSPVRFIATALAGAATQLVKISGDAQQGVTGNPLAAPMVVEARDALANPVAGVTIGFTAIAGGGTPASQSVVTNASGQAVFTLTLGAPGADSVKACLPSCATAQVLFSALSIPVGADAIWTGATSSAWGTAANWSPAVVPGSVNKVFVPAGTPNSPVLAADAAVLDMTLASGATLNLATFQMAMGGSLYATGATMSGTTGYVYFCGGSHTISGAAYNVYADCGATVTPAGAAVVAGPMTVRNSSVLDIGAGDLTVTGDFAMLSGGRVKMVQPTAHLLVKGNYYSNPGNDVGDTWMTDGILEIQGHLTTNNSCCGQSFRAVGNHVTRFSGTGPQTISLAFAHEGYHRETFGHVEFTGNNTVTLGNHIRVWGTVTVKGTTRLAGNNYLLHGGQLTTDAGTNLSALSYTQLNAGGAVFPIIRGVGPGTVQLAHDGGAFPGNNVVSLPQASDTLPTNLETHGGMVLDLTTKELLVAGNFGMYSSSRVKMIQSAAHFLVGGNYYSNPGNDVGDTWMTDGVLELKGNLTTDNACCGQSFRAVGNHVTRFSGTAPQTISLAFAHEGYHRETFGRVEFAGNNTVTLGNHVRVWGSVRVKGLTKLAGSGKYLLHGGQLTTDVGTDLSALSYTQLNAGGAVFPLIRGVGPTVVQLAFDGGAFPGNNVVSLPQASDTLPTNLETHGGMVLDLTSRELLVTGNFGMHSTSRVKMTQPGAHFLVAGDYYSNPGNDVGDTWMTDGLLELRGHLTTNNACCGQSFRAVGNHVTRFSGTGPQTISLAFAHEGYHRETFGHVEFTGNNTVTLGNNIRVWGSVKVKGITKVAGNTKYLLHGGQLTTDAGTDLSGLSYTQLNAGGAIFPLIRGVGPGIVQVAIDGGAFPASNTVSLPQASDTLPTNLETHGNTVLDLANRELLVSGSFGMYSSSRVKMTQAGAHFLVDGNYYSNPGNDVGDAWMTDGLLELRGHLTTNNACCGQSFRAVGNHVTRFSGTAPQTISLAFAHEGYHRETFGHVEFTGNNTVTLGNNIRVWGSVKVKGFTKIAGSTKYLLHGGQLTTDVGTDLSGLSYTQLNAGGAVFPLIRGVGPTVVQLAYDGGAFPGNNVVSLPQASDTLPTNLETHGGMVLDLTTKELLVAGNFSMYSTSRVAMQNSAAHFLVGGDYYSNPGNDVGDTWMTDGILELKGNLTTNNACCGQSFRAMGNHLTRFSGTGPQTISFAFAHEGYHRETLGQMQVTNASALGVRTGNSVRIWGGLTNNGRLTINAGHTVYVGGALTLGATSTTSNSGGVSKASCSAAVGAVYTGFTCP